MQLRESGIGCVSSPAGANLNLKDRVLQSPYVGQSLDEIEHVTPNAIALDLRVHTAHSCFSEVVQLEEYTYRIMYAADILEVITVCSIRN